MRGPSILLITLVCVRRMEFTLGVVVGCVGIKTDGREAGEKKIVSSRLAGPARVRSSLLNDESKEANTRLAQGAYLPCQG